MYFIKLIIVQMVISCDNYAEQIYTRISSDYSLVSSFAIFRHYLQPSSVFLANLYLLFKPLLFHRIEFLNA